MTDHSTQLDDEQFSVKGPPPEGFTILYNQIASALLDEHSAVIKCYLALCLYSNQDRKCFLSLQTLGEEMGDMSRDSARRAVARLEELEILRVYRPENQGRGQANVYYLQAPKKGSTHAPLPREKGSKSNQEGLQENGKRVAPAMQPQQDVEQDVEQDYPPTPLKGGNGSVDDEREEFRREAQPHQQPMAQPRRAQPQEGNDVYNSNHTPVREVDNPWWTENRQKVFQFFYDNYPKMSPVIEAKIAMRLSVGEKIDDPQFMNSLWHGLQWWKNKWRQEDTEERYIPGMGRWFERRQWEQAAPPLKATVTHGS